MAKIEIIGPKNDFFEVVSLLHEQGKLHIEDLSRKISSGEVPLQRMEVYETQQQDQEQMEELLIRVRAIVKALHRDDLHLDPAARRTQYSELFAKDAGELATEVTAVIEEVEDRTAELATSRTSLESELSLLARYEPILQKIQPLAKQIVTTGAYESVALLVERRYKSALELLKEELDKITHKQCEIVSTDVDENTTAVIVVFSKTYSEPVHKFLAMENVNQIRLPSSFEDMPFDAAYESLKERQGHLPAELEKVSIELEEMSKAWYLRLMTIRDVLIDKIEEISAIPKFGRTDYAFVINGWIPVKDVEELRQGISSKWGDDIIVTQTEVTEAEYGDTPVATKNPKAIAPFEKIIGVRGVPRYGTVDPTWLLFIFFPLFYGMIVGDAGYGTIMLAVIVWLRLKFKQNEVIQMATSIIGPAATMVIAFGVAYGELFGDLPSRAGWVYPVTGSAYAWLADGTYAWFGILPIFHRVAEILPFMLIAIAAGVVHVLLGLVLGVINAVRTGQKKHLKERGGILMMLLAILILVGVGQLAVLSGTGEIAFQLAVAAIAIAGFVYAIKGGGVMGVVETLESFTHMASYIRIMAVGLAGALFADAINQIVVILSPPGSISIVGILLGVILHSLHVVMASFSPMIHALRLNLLEFFSKFYETGNQPYSPFTKTGGEERV
ncbi:MAG: V-type ATP synthase subunit I [Anaerosomatales bacterium]